MNTKTITIRLSEEKYEKLKEKAEAAGRTISGYLVDAAMQTRVPPYILRKAYRGITDIKDAVMQKESKEEILERCDKLWQSLK